MVEFYGADDENENPIAVLKRWMEAARDAGEELIDAADLATVDAAGLPNLRIVFIREIEEEGLVFYTNYHGRKGRELTNASGDQKGALNFYYKSQWRQMRLRGLVEKTSEAQSDRYFHAREEGSRKGAWASKQSEPLESREELMERWNSVTAEMARTRPPNWGGFRLIPQEIEFWVAGEFRLHDRFRWTRKLALGASSTGADSPDDAGETLSEPIGGNPWQMTRLYP